MTHPHEGKLRCIKCLKEKPLCEFYDNKRGKLKSCKSCLKKYHHERKLYFLSQRFFGGNKELVLYRDNYKCVQCGMTNEEHLQKWNRMLTVDHIDGCGRNSKTKNHSSENLQTLCMSCHGRKDTKRRKTL